MACANIIAPSGGPKDETAPQLIDSLCYPNTSYNTNRSGSNILLIFNETTEIVSLNTQLTSTPLINNKLIKYKTKSIKLKDTSGKSYNGTAVSIDLNQKLDSNTTYVLNFGRSFKDINEGKIATNISIAFSTGSIIDSLSITGNALFNTTGKIAKDVMIALYTINDTSNAINTLPKYYTNTDELGDFELNYLKPNNYRIASFTDKNRNKKYDPNTEYIAFYKDQIKLDSMFNSGTLLLCKEDNKKTKINKIDLFDQLAIITFNKGLEDLTIKNYNNNYIKLNSTRKKLTIYKKLLQDTSLTMSFSDSTSVFSDSTISLHFNSLKKYPIKTTQTSNNQYINKEITQIISFSQPIFETYLDTATIYAPDTTYKFDSLKDMTWNLNKTELSITYHLPKYHDTISINNLDFISITKDTLHISSTLPRTESGQFGSVYFNVVPNEPHYIIYILDKTNKIIATGRNVNKMSIVNYKPQSLYIKILIDSNNNGKYDNGDYLLNTLPEEYLFIKEPVQIKAGWDIEDIDIIVKSGSHK